ncbi:MAG: pre-peptidase C-terminal domain-containing protein [Pyrinomonadaceae bacterium]
MTNSYLQVKQAVAVRLAIRLVLFAAIGSLVFASGWRSTGTAAAPQEKETKSRRRPQQGKQIPPRPFGSKGEGKARQSAKSDTIRPLALGCNPVGPINFGQTINGALSTSDCRLPDNSYFDVYTFAASAGQQVTISMSSSSFDTYLVLLDAADEFIAEDDDGGGGTNSRISVTLPAGGTYSIIANSFDPNTTGSYSVTLTSGGGGGCTIATPVPIQPGQNNGALTASDCVLPDGSHYDLYTFSATAGQQVAISMSGNFDTYLALVAPDGEVLAEDNNGGGGTNARIPQSTGFAALPATGTYNIIATSFAAGVTGNYSVTLSVAPTPCPQTPISLGQTVNGALAANDCRLPFDGSFFDAYTFSGTAGQQIAVSMSAGFDAYLYLLLPNGSLAAEDADGGGGTNARIPAGSGFFTLPVTGSYTILANSAAPNLAGDYTLSLTTNAPTCTYTFAPTTQQVGSAGGNFSLTATTQGNCTFVANSNASWITITSASIDSNGVGTVNYAVAQNTAPTSRTGTITVGNQTFTVTQAAALTCTYALVPAAQQVGATGGTFSFAVTTQAGCAVSGLSNVNWITTFNTGGTTVNYAVAQNTTGASRTGTINVGGQTFTVTQSAACSFAVYPPVRAFTHEAGGGRLTVVASSTECDRGNITTDAPWINIVSGANGAGTGRVRYAVAANEGAATRTGRIFTPGGMHTVTQTAVGTTPAIQFSAATYQVSEGVAGNAATITVSRLGDVAGAASVEFATVDDMAAVPCNPASLQPNGQPYPRGAAYARCDYATTVDTLVFGPNETTKSFTIPLVNDVHPDGDETFQLVLRNPAGATLGSPSTATVTITDDDTASSTNPIFGSPFFVRMQYLDFLSREPEPGGFQTWLNVLNNCSDVNNNPACDRLIVSQSFFGSDEFRLKGFYVFLFYKAAFGSQAEPNYVPEYEEIIAAMRRVTGLTGEEVVAKRLDFGEDLVNSPAFVNRYGVVSQTQYVDSLLANVGATLQTPDPVSGVTRDSLVADLNADRKSKLDVLRLVVESQEVGTVQYNHAFVAMQYYGYLRRKPEPEGYAGWLDAIGRRGESPRVMVNGFMNSDEYKLRFGTP